jgi:hypothetical protein
MTFCVMTFWVIHWLLLQRSWLFGSSIDFFCRGHDVLGHPSTSITEVMTFWVIHRLLLQRSWLFGSSIDFCCRGHDFLGHPSTSIAEVTTFWVINRILLQRSWLFGSCNIHGPKHITQCGDYGYQKTHNFTLISKI